MPPSTAPVDRPTFPDPGRLAASVLARFGTPLAGLALFLVFALASDNFFTLANQLTILRQASFLLILSVGFTFALIAAELDLSFGSVASLAGVVTGGLVHFGYPIGPAILAGLVTATAFGFANGLLVTVAKIPSLIATLATGSIATGLAFAATNGVAWVGRWDPSFVWLGRGRLFGLPVLILWSLLTVALAWFVVGQTRFGVWLTATGEADEAARLAGVAVRRMKVWALTLSGLCAGVAAVLLTAALSSAAPTSADDFLMSGIAAVLLGMTMFTPGKANVPGTAVGALMITVLSNGLVLLGAPYFVQDIALGVIILLSVALSASTLKKAAFGL